jgi:hypothetical protein
MSNATLAPGSGPAAVALAALLLAGCAGDGTDAPSPQPPACPGALILQGAERTTAYAEGAAADPQAQRYLAVVTNLASACNYLEGAVDVDLAFDLIVERGPALEGDSVELTYFVATMGPGEEILAKQLLSSAIAFEAAERVAGSREQLTLRLPAVTPADGAAYALYLGFQLDGAELDQRLQPLLR